MQSLNSNPIDREAEIFVAKNVDVRQRRAKIVSENVVQSRAGAADEVQVFRVRAAVTRRCVLRAAHDSRWVADCRGYGDRRNRKWVSQHSGDLDARAGGGMEAHREGLARQGRHFFLPAMERG